MNKKHQNKLILKSQTINSTFFDFLKADSWAEQFLNI